MPSQIIVRPSREVDIVARGWESQPGGWASQDDSVWYSYTVPGTPLEYWPCTQMGGPTTEAAEPSMSCLGSAINRLSLPTRT